MRTHSRARGWALQTLYAWESRGGVPEAAIRVLGELAEDMRIAPANRLYAEVLVRIVDREIVALDRLLREHLANWRLDRLSAIDRNILRLGVAELVYVDDVAGRVTVREMVRLAERYGTPESPRFVNGVLEAVMRAAAPGKMADHGKVAEDG
jgi:transcription antitermination protein NusB